MKCKRVIYFHNGSIGDFLLTLHLMENIHISDTMLELVIAVPRNSEACRELAAMYPYIEVVEVNKRAIRTLLSYLTGGNCIVTPPTPGQLPFVTKLAAKLLSVLPGERLVGFDDGAWANRFLYDTLLSYDARKPYYETMYDVARALGFDVKVSEQTFSFPRRSEVFERFDLLPHHYVVIHPFGSNERRSILGEGIESIVAAVKERFDGTIVLSGSTEDCRAHRAMLDGLKEQGVVLVAGDVSMCELATLLQDAVAYIGVDTGISHLASLLRTKGLVISHGGSIEGWLPFYNENGRVLYALKDGTYTGTDASLARCTGDVHCFQKPTFESIQEEINRLFA